MEYVTLGRTGLRIAPAVMGTMTFGREADEETSRALVDHALDAGINAFDCADLYGRGTAEEILGRALEGRRERVVLMTKVGFAMGEGPNETGTAPARLRPALEASLRRLRTDRVEVYFLHRFDPNADLMLTLRGLEDMRRAGMYVHLGLSNFAAWQVQKALGLAALSGFEAAQVIQPMYSLLKRQAEVEILPMAADAGLGVVPYSPLGAGLLTAKTAAASGDAARMATDETYRSRYGDVDAQAIAARFVALAQARDVDPATLAVAWARTHPAVTAPILGARSVAQLAPSLVGASYAMDDALRAEISALTAPPPVATDRAEEQRGNAMA